MRVGEEIVVIGLFVEPFTYGVLEGSEETIRRHKARSYEAKLSEMHPYCRGRWIAPPPEGIHDAHAVIAQLRSYAGGEGYEVSTLVVLAYSDGFPERPLEFLQGVVDRLDWRRLAEHHDID